MSGLEAVEVPVQQELDPTIWLEKYGDYLYRYAIFRLRDPSAAEDAVQETLLAALKSSKRFAGRSNERTWLVGILKHKISDYFRRYQETTVDDTLTDQDFFDKDGSWKKGSRPVGWDSNPEVQLQSKDFQRTLEFCINKLPENLARVFVLREVDELTTEEICKLLNITPGNLWVMLHRARLQLQRLMSIHWFKTGSDVEESKKPLRSSRLCRPM